MKQSLLLLCTLAFFSSAFAQPQVDLVQVAAGITRPVDITHADDDRTFVVGQHGYIYILDLVNNNHIEFLDIDARVRSTSNEQGLLGLAFHPNYQQNGYFYVNYTDNDGNSRVSRFSVSGNNPDSADENSEVILLSYNQPYSNHNGGDVTFGPDGYLYVSTGDGGSQGDPSGNAQSLQSFLGKILRIDIDNGSPYAVPADNPFVSTPNALPEIWAYGLRNPWRMSFDRLTGDLWIGDVGQNSWEEIDFQSANSPGGENYGWRCREGEHNYNTNNCPPLSSFISPVFEYENSSSVGCSVTGGLVYRGSTYPELYGHYLLADYCSGRMWSVFPDTAAGSGWEVTFQGDFLNSNYSAFGEDSAGNVFLAARNAGTIFEVRSDNCNGLSVATLEIVQPCAGETNGALDLEISGGTGPYTISWNHGPSELDLDSVATGFYTLTVTDQNMCTATQSFVMQEETLPTPALDIQGSTTYCAGEPIDLVLSSSNLPPMTSYQWYLNGQALTTDTMVLLSPTLPGFYQLQFTGRCSSQLSDSVELQEFIPLVPTIGAIADTLSASPAESYQWFLNGDSIAGANSDTYVATVSGSYSLLTTDENGCEAVSESYQHLATGLPGGLFHELVIAPNPAAHAFHLRGELAGIGPPDQLQIRLLDALGRERWVKSLPVQAGRVSAWFSLREEAAGTYFIQISTETQQVVKSLLLIK
jgi:glucose/arabinose dehydrogenase